MPSPSPSAAAGFPALTLVLFCLPVDASTRVTSTLDAIAKLLVPTATFSTLTGTGGRLEDGALSLAFCDSCSFANDLLVRSAGPAPNPVLAAGFVLVEFKRLDTRRPHRRQVTRAPLRRFHAGSR